MDTMWCGTATVEPKGDDHRPVQVAIGNCRSEQELLDTIDVYRRAGYRVHDVQTLALPPRTA